MPYETRTMSLLVGPDGDPSYSEMATTISIAQEGNGEFVDVAQSVGIDLQPYQDQAREALREEYEALEPPKKATADTAAVLYRGPSGETWSGRGQQPTWVRAALKQGTTLDALRVAAKDEDKPAPKAAAGRGRKSKTSAADAAAGIAQALQALPEGATA